MEHKLKRVPAIPGNRFFFNKDNGDDGKFICTCLREIGPFLKAPYLTFIRFRTSFFTKEIGPGLPVINSVRMENHACELEPLVRLTRQPIELQNFQSFVIAEHGVWIANVS